MVSRLWSAIGSKQADLEGGALSGAVGWFTLVVAHDLMELESLRYWKGETKPMHWAGWQV